MTKLSGPMLAPASGGQPKQAVVMLHGYGSNGNDLIGLAPYWSQRFRDALFVAPDAPTQCDGFAEGYQWFEIDFAGDRLAGRQSGVLKARPVLEQFLRDMWAQTGILPENTILGGFSQGAMMALHVGLALEERVMGVIAFSGAFLPPAGYDDPAGTKPAVCIVHGAMDDVVSPRFSAEANELLVKAGYDVSYLERPGLSHSIDQASLDFATAFIERVMPK